jgi:hypothetical protein
LIFFGGSVLNGAMSLLGFSETLIANFGINEGSVLKFLPETPWCSLFIYSLGPWSFILQLFLLFAQSFVSLDRTFSLKRRSS